MNELQPSSDLPLEIPANEPGRVSLSCSFFDSDDQRCVLINNQLCYRYELNDTVTEAMVWISVYQSGFASLKEIADQIDPGLRTLQLWNKSVKEKGLSSLRHKPKSGRPTTVSEVDRNLAIMHIETGKSPKEITKLLDISHDQLRRIRKSIDTTESHTELLNLDFGDDQTPNKEDALNANDEDEEVSITQSVGVNPDDRSVDRAYARLGLLEDAQPIFAEGERIEGLGFLMMVALLAQTQVFQIFDRLYEKHLGASFYGLRTTVMTVLMMLALRVKRPENLRHNDPKMLGRPLGLDRVMEVKTLRRKLSTLADKGIGIDLMKELAKDRLTRRAPLNKDQLESICIDGHVKCYYGGFKIGKTWSAIKNRVVKGKTNTWINLSDQIDLIYLDSPFNEGLTKMLDDHLSQIEEYFEEKPVLVFDRECWDVDFLHRIDQAGWRFITYRKGNYTSLPTAHFVKGRTEVGKRTYQHAPLDTGKQPYNHYQTVEKEGKLKRTLVGQVSFREIRVLSDDESHQTAIVTNIDKSDAHENIVCATLFERWGNQENVFKYKIAELGLDDLWEYNRSDRRPTDSRKSEELIPNDIDHPNPEFIRINREIAKVRSQQNKILSRYGLELERGIDDMGNVAEISKEQLTEFVVGIRSDSDIQKLTELNESLSDLLSRRQILTPRECVADADYKQLRRGVGHIVDNLKMVYFEMETRLYEKLGKYYPNHQKDGRRLIAAAMRSAGTLKLEPGKLQVSLVPQSTPKQTEAIHNICRELNALGSIYPGTDRVIEFCVD